MGIAVVKPDHIGDLVLSAPAIRAILSRRADTTLFVASGNLPLARFLFGDIDIRSLDLPHLSKKGEAVSRFMDFRGFDLVVFLRHDDVLNPAGVRLFCKDYAFYSGNNDYHQSVLDYTVASHVVGEYDIDAAFFGSAVSMVREKSTRSPESVGLCIGAGFFANCWPVAYWTEFGTRLKEIGCRVSLVCGPSEANFAGVIARALRIKDHAVICGDDDYRHFLSRVAELDWIVASDGGTAHLCSLVAPVLSIFGGSPFRRYAPFGVWNRLLTLDLPCSPCCQYASRAINGCLSNECVVEVDPLIVLSALSPPFTEIAYPYFVEMGGGCKLFLGASHLDRRQVETIGGNPVKRGEN